MSGFEIAGVVLGAFPIALHLLDDYREMAKRAGLWYRIRLEYTKCRNDVEFQRVALSSHLRQLILPLLVDDDKANRLLSEPGGESWKDPAIDGLLRDRLGHTYDLYLGYIEGMEDVMGELNKELSMDSTAVQERLSTSKAATAATSLRNAANKAEFQLYRIRFSNGEAKRKELLGKLQEYNGKLERLLSTSDRDAQLNKQRAAVQYKTSIDAALCNFWSQATRVFQALAAAWNCTCGQDQHITKLLLQHRTDKKSEFDMLFSAKESSGWRINAALPPRQPGHRKTPAINLKSAMRTKSAAFSTISGQRTVVQVPYSLPDSTSPPGEGNDTDKRVRSSSVTISTVQVDKTSPVPYRGPSPVSLTLDIPPILSLCLLVKQPAQQPTLVGNPSCYGYVTATDGDDPSHSCVQAPRKFYLHTVWEQQISFLTILTFDQIITTGVSRKQRYLLALTLASSFLQLLDTPWLPVSWNRSDIVFLLHSQQTDLSQQLQPYLRRDISLLPLSHTPSTNLLSLGSGSGGKTPIIDLNRGLDKLGILLLELCFGQLLETQYNKMRLTPGAGEEKTIFDLYVARSWLYEVEEEAGREYFEAVAWCLGSVSSDKWRVDMLKNVVEPLVRCAGWVDGVFT